ncbi:hypothetical protein TNCT_68641, partial [Trichonephila clavata]
MHQREEIHSNMRSYKIELFSMSIKTSWKNFNATRHAGEDLTAFRYITGPPQNGYRREYATMEPYAASIIKVITLRRRGNAPLGFSIRGGWEHGTGVFVSEIIPGSIAQKQGLRVGDQIVRINGFSIHRAIHMEVLSLLKTCPGIVLKIKRVGILPVKERDKDPVTWKIVEPHHSSLIYSDQVAHSRMNGSTLENSIIVKVEISVPGNASLGC